MQSIEWRPIPEFPDHYEITTDGQVKRIKDGPGVTVGLILKTQIQSNGYESVNLTVAGKTYKRWVHRMICQAFLGPAVGREACHNNGVSLDNRLENLRWGTRRENAQDTLKHGHNVNANKTHCVNGHAFDSANTRERPSGGRACRTCAAAAVVKSRAEERARRDPKPDVCKRGHSLEDAYIAYRKDGRMRRNCKPCTRARAAGKIKANNARSAA